MLPSPHRLSATARTLISITTCSRPDYVRSQLPSFARCARELGDADVVLSVDGLSVRGNPEALEAALSFGVSCVVSDRAEGVGVSKNRVVALLGGYDYYFFVDDDVELRDCRVFPAHVGLHLGTGIHHFCLHDPRRLLEEVSRTCDREAGTIRHAMYGGAQFSFFTRVALERVGGWHPLFAPVRRGGHTEHSYRIYRSGLCPAPFNLVEGLVDCCVWKEPPSVVRNRGMRIADNQLYELENDLIRENIESMPFTADSPGRLVKP